MICVVGLCHHIYQVFNLVLVKPGPILLVFSLVHLIQFIDLLLFCDRVDKSGNMQKKKEKVINDRDISEVKPTYQAQAGSAIYRFRSCYWKQTKRIKENNDE